VAKTQAISPTQRARLGALNHDALYFSSPCQRWIAFVRGGRREKRRVEEEERRKVGEKEKRYYVSCK
jgi:hypothetical protein